MLRGTVVLCVVMLVMSVQPAVAAAPFTNTTTETFPLSGTILECPLEAVVATSGTTTLTITVTTRGDPPNFYLRVHSRSDGQGLGLVSSVPYRILSQDISVLAVYPGLDQSFFMEHKLISLGGLPDATFFSQYKLIVTPGGVPTVTRERTECRTNGAP